MKYSPDNIQVSLTIQFADTLRSAGYDVRWQITGDVDAQTSTGSTKGTVTLVKEAPANPEYIVRLNDGELPTEKQIPIPALTLQLVGGEERGKRVGLGHSEFFRKQRIQIDGFVSDEYQQAEFVALLKNWIDRNNVWLNVWDYTTATPEELSSVEVVKVSVDKAELVEEIESIRYYIFARFEIEYVE
jgi:hypothetical protein